MHNMRRRRSREKDEADDRKYWEEGTGIRLADRGGRGAPRRSSSGGGSGNPCKVILAIVSLLFTVFAIATWVAPDESWGVVYTTQSRISDAWAGLTENDDSPNGSGQNAGTTTSIPDGNKDNDQITSDCRTASPTRGSDGEYSSDNLRVVEVAVSSSGGDIVEVSGEIIDRCKEKWSLITSDDYGTFAIYRWPEPRGYGYSSESPIGSILEPAGGNTYYTGLSPSDRIAESYVVREDSFRIRYRSMPQHWGATYRLGVWGWDVEKRQPGLLADVKID